MRRPAGSWFRRVSVGAVMGACLLGVALGASVAPGSRRAVVSLGNQGSPPISGARCAWSASSVAALMFAASSQNPEEEGKHKHDALFKLINFVILAGALAFLLRRPLAEFFNQRSNSIRESLEEGRKALEASEAQLRAVEEKLRSLEDQISGFKAAAAQEIEAERERLRQAVTREAEKILELARAEIDAATRAAKLELKIYAARQAVDLAEAMIRQRLDQAGQRRLVARFVGALTPE